MSSDLVTELIDSIKKVQKENAAVVLLSGGIDSATCLAIAKRRHKRVVALSFNYNQRHKVEIEFAKRLAKSVGVDNHLIINLDLSFLKSSALTGDRELPLDRDMDTIKNEGIPTSYVPARNTIFLAYALAVCEEHNIENIYIGVNSIDYSGYPDCRPQYIEAFKKVALLGTKMGVEGRQFYIETPLINLKKHEIIQVGSRLGLDFSNTISCYNPTTDGLSCGRCDSCIIRKEAFKRADFPDPTAYI